MFARYILGKDARTVRCALLITIFSCVLGAGQLTVRKNLDKISISTDSFNPSIGRSVRIGFSLKLRSTVQLEILDRDGFKIRKYDLKSLAAGVQTAQWDGKDEAGSVVPDEAYTIRLTATSGRLKDVYDPLMNFVPVDDSPQKASYSKSDGLISYSLDKKSRVHLQLIQNVPVAGADQTVGVVLKTIVDHAPRPAGSVIEAWQGYDESGRYEVAKLPENGVTILATTLPENAVITYGNKKIGFLEYALNQRGDAFKVPRHFESDGMPHHTHSGLNAFEDHSPEMKIAILKSQVKATELIACISLESPALGHFLNQPNRLELYVDDSQYAVIPHPEQPATARIDFKILAPGDHRLTVNWVSEFGPLSANSISFSVPGPAIAETKVTRGNHP